MRTIGRRALLRGAGGVAIALPMLEAMHAREARAAARPKRLVIVYSPNGTNNPVPRSHEFVPKETGAAFVLGKEVAPLEPLRKRLLILSGVHAPSCKPDIETLGDLHSIGMSQMLTGVRYVLDKKFYKMGGSELFAGYAGGISVDQHIGKRLAAPTRFATLELGVHTLTDTGVHPFSRMISAGPNQPIPAEDDPAAAFARLFRDGSNDASAAMERTRVQRRSVLDFVRGDLERAQALLGARDRQKLEYHLTAVRDLEARIARSSAPMTSPACGGVSFTPGGDPRDKANFPAVGRQQMDLLVLALKCDVTRVASLQWSWARSNLLYSWLGSSKGHHDLSHGQGTGAELTAINTWYASQLAYLGTALAAADEGDGTSVLDHSVIYWCSEINWGLTHSFEDMRVVLLGDCGGALKTGQHLALGGQSHQKLLVTLMNAMGVMENQFGDATYGTGPLPGVLA